MSDTTNPSTGKTSTTETPHTAGAFDIRFVIAALIGVYGLALLLLGLFNASDEELARADGLNLNLWAGLGMVVFAAAFVAWGRLRPVIVPAHDAAQDPVQDSAQDSAAPQGEQDAENGDQPR